jgi:hypothetical protein
VCVCVCAWSPNERTSERVKPIAIGDDIMIMITKLLLLLSLSLSLSLSLEFHHIAQLVIVMVMSIDSDSTERSESLYPKNDGTKYYVRISLLITDKELTDAFFEHHQKFSNSTQIPQLQHHRFVARSNTYLQLPTVTYSNLQ